MQKLNFLIIVLVCCFGISFSSKSQDMKPPAPVECKTLDMAVGEHVSEPYEMMGMKWTGTVKHSWAHNHQFFTVEVMDIADNGATYSATGIMYPDKDGNLKGWFFDDWGAGGILEVSGKAEGNHITLTGTNSMGTFTRVAEINGDDINVKWTMVMKGKDGKDMTMNGATVLHRKK